MYAFATPNIGSLGSGGGWEVTKVCFGLGLNLLAWFSTFFAMPCILSEVYVYLHMLLWPASPAPYSTCRCHYM